MVIFSALAVLLPLVIAYPQPDPGAHVTLAEIEPGTNYTLKDYRTSIWFRNVFAPGRPSQFQFTKFCPEGETDYEHCQHFTDYDLYMPSPGRIQFTEDGLLTILNVTEDDVGEYFPAISEEDPSQPMVTVRLVLKTAEQHPVNLPEPSKTVRKRSITVQSFNRLLASRDLNLFDGQKHVYQPRHNRNHRFIQKKRYQ